MWDKNSLYFTWNKEKWFYSQNLILLHLSNDMYTMNATRHDTVNNKWIYASFFTAQSSRENPVPQVHRLNQLNLTQQEAQEKQGQAWMPSWELALGQMVNPSLNQSGTSTQQKAVNINTNQGGIDNSSNPADQAPNCFVWTFKWSAFLLFIGWLDLLLRFFCLSGGLLWRKYCMLCYEFCIVTQLITIYVYV